MADEKSMAASRTMRLRGLGLAALAHDVVMAAASLPLAIFLRRGLDIAEMGPWALTREALVFAAIAAAVFLLLRPYRGLWRHAGAADMVAIARAASLAVLLYLPVAFAIERLEGLPRSVPVIQWLLLVALMGGPRLAVRLWAGRSATTAAHGTAPSVLLVGSGEGTAALLRALDVVPQATFHVLGALALDDRERGRSIGGTPVLGTLRDLEGVVARLGRAGRRPERLVVAEAAAGSWLRPLVGRAEAMGLTISRLSARAVLEAALGGGSVGLQPLPLAELLGRPPVALDRGPVRAAIAGRRVLVTGAGGSIGGELARQIAAFGPSRLVLLDNSEYALYAIDQQIGEGFPALPRGAVLADIRDRARIRQVFAAERPEVVFHAAALKHVPMVELNATEGAATNVLGTRSVADAALACGTDAMVLVSTDKAVNPTSVMGACKRLAELYCQAQDLAGLGRPGPRTRFVTVRFGNVLGSSGSVVPLFQHQLAQGGPLTVTHPEITRFFMLIPEAVELVLQALAHGIRPGATRGEVLVLDMGEPIRVADLARHMIRLAGKEPERDVRIEITGLRPGEKLYEELFDATEERRPAASGLMAANSAPIEGGLLRRGLDEMARACAAHDAASVLAVLGRTVPGYDPPTESPTEAEAA